MDNFSLKMPLSKSNREPLIGAIEKSNSGHAAEERLQSFDVADCRVNTYVDGLAECVTPQCCNICGYSIPFASTFFCKHPQLVQSISR